MENFGVFQGRIFGHFLYIFSRFGLLYQEKSGNPVSIDNIRNGLNKECWK
jgi:hypothetical protein